MIFIILLLSSRILIRFGLICFGFWSMIAFIALIALQGGPRKFQVRSQELQVRFVEAPSETSQEVLRESQEILRTSQEILGNPRAKRRSMLPARVFFIQPQTGSRARAPGLGAEELPARAGRFSHQELLRITRIPCHDLYHSAIIFEDFDQIWLDLLWILVHYSFHSSHSSLGRSQEVPSEIVGAPSEIRRSSK